jgi:hypothetical protein
MTDIYTANIGVLGGVAYAAYDNWNRPWDRRYVSAATVGLIALWGGEGYVLFNTSNPSLH